MKKFIIIHKDEITNSLRKTLKICATRSFIEIQLTDGTTSNYCVASLFDDEIYIDQLNNYRKFNLTEMNAKRTMIEQSQAVSRLVNEHFKTTAYGAEDQTKVRLKGAFKISTTSTETKSQTTVMSEDKKLNGICYNAHACNYGDTFTVEILDSDDNVLETYVENWYVTAGGMNIRTDETLLKKDMKIKTTYTNAGGDAADFTMNLLAHKVGA